MKKGVILEIKERYVTLLTPDGEFVRTRRLQQDYQIGEELYFYPMESEREKVGHFLANLKGVKGKLIFSALVVLLAVVFIPIYQSNQVYAYMSIDVNPSIELGLNDQLLVVSLNAFNQEGEEVLENVSGWKKETAAVVAKKILTEIEEMGYLEEESEVLISTVNPAEQSAEGELDETISEIKNVSEAEELQVTVVTATPAERENAVKQGISAGQYKQKQQLPRKEQTSNQSRPETDHPKTSNSLGKNNLKQLQPLTNGQGNGNGLDKEQKQQEKDRHKDKAQKQQQGKDNTKGNVQKQQGKDNAKGNAQKQQGKDNAKGNAQKQQGKDNAKGKTQKQQENVKEWDKAQKQADRVKPQNKVQKHQDKGNEKKNSKKENDDRGSQRKEDKGKRNGNSSNDQGNKW